MCSSVLYVLGNVVLCANKQTVFYLNFIFINVPIHNGTKILSCTDYKSYSII